MSPRSSGFAPIKLNSVIVRGFNDDEVIPLLEFARNRGLVLRYIEYMDVGGATRWRREDVVTRADLLETIAARHSEPPSRSRIVTIPPPPPSEFRLPDGRCSGSSPR